MSDFPEISKQWMWTTVTGAPEAIVLNEDSGRVEGEFDSLLSAWAYIEDEIDRRERLGEDRANYHIIPVRATPGGKDIR